MVVERRARQGLTAPNGGVADSLDEAKAAFRAAWEQQRPQMEERRAL
jgi:hypothetical protein